MALEEVTEALASEEFEARVESVARFVRDVDRPLDRRSNTLEPEDLAWDNYVMCAWGIMMVECVFKRNPYDSES